ncbi:iron-siderophore ABC transporter substrate-binding protein [Devosia sp. WQ 349]|uniref:ABC transporter substrate-binding protein n=1 Tax=Devosia sp. WQ 349K1 TaxID=2800329 RepID=UPI00190571A2|nr:iron-siderophore ABC transporter substrate-binding protein [Devosia sp. WQ 349K1]MBK1792893.1 iron-siderophore ABC transporter substrate-binding protein [Devosia sp. WQ 349K1]
MRNLKIVVIAASVACVAAFASSAGAREVTHSMGTTDVPDAPQRVVVLTNEGTEALLAVGITPVGAVRSWLGDPWYDHIADQMADVTVLGEESAINLELLAALEPDLIIGTKIRHEQIYEQLSAIAPTVISERLRGDWKINMELYAEAVGKSAEAEAAFAAYDARIAATSAALGDAKAEEISLVRFMAGRTRIYLNDTFAGNILSQIGFARPANQDRDEFADEVTKERIPEFQGDRLFYFIYETGDGAADTAAAEWMADPLWAALPVVAAGKAQGVSDATWNTAGGILAANVMLDDIEAIYGLPATRK